LTTEEADQQGPLLHRSAVVIDNLLEPEQTYVCLWSHAGGAPVHLRYVVQPIGRSLMDDFGGYGPRFQAETFARGAPPPEQEVVAFAEKARRAFVGVR
jgi:hypothetical protein